MTEVLHWNGHSYIMESGSTLGVYSPKVTREINTNTRYVAYRLTIVRNELCGENALMVEHLILYAPQFPHMERDKQTGFPITKIPCFYSPRKNPLINFVPDSDGPNDSDPYREHETISTPTWT